MPGPKTLRALIWTGALATALAAGPALARGMKVGDLGPVTARADCLTRARAVLKDYIDQYGGLSISDKGADPDAWAVYGWGLRPGVTDVAITCPVVGDRTNAFFSIHSDGPAGAAHAETVGDRLTELWKTAR